MNKKTLILLAVVFGLSGLLSALAQTPSQGVPQDVPSPQTQGPSQDISSLFDNQGRRRYLLGPGDLLDVRVFSQSDLNSVAEIDDDGFITSLPFLEDPIPAKCHTEKQVQALITAAYSKYLRKPRVSVRVLERRSRHPAVVFGAVRAPTRIQMMRRTRLHELLAAAGGITQTASGTIQIIHTEAELCNELSDIPEVASMPSIPVSDKAEATNTIESLSGSISDKLPQQTASTTSDKGVVPASGSVSDKSTKPTAATSSDKVGPSPSLSDKNAQSTTALASGKGEQPNAVVTSDIGQLTLYQLDAIKAGKEDPYVRPGDIVIVTEGEPIYITGAVVAPREIVTKDKITLGMAIAMSGGIQRLAKSHEVHIYRRKEGKIGNEDLKFDYDAIKKGQQPDVLLQAYDIIDVRTQSTWSPKSLSDFFLNITKGSLGGVTGAVPYRILY